MIPTSGQVIPWVLQSHFQLLADLIPKIALQSEAYRAAAELDGLVISGREAIELASAEISEPSAAENLSAATLVVLTLGAEEHYPALVSHLCGGNADFRGAVRAGLRLSNVQGIWSQLQAGASKWSEGARIALYDIATFHRMPLALDLPEASAVGAAEDRVLLVDAMGRRSDVRGVRRFENDLDPGVRRSLWGSLARAGDPVLIERLRAHARGRQPCHAAIRFLGVIGSLQDREFLEHLASDPATAQSAIHAMGSLGAVDLIPSLIRRLADTQTSQAATAAIERITGVGIPRHDPPAPPPGLSEEELDDWSHPGEPVEEAVVEWWENNRDAFKPGERYQEGVCISADPLGSAWHSLSDDVQKDVYLRERALNPRSTPDWELETWPSFHRIPNWSSLGMRLCRGER